MSSRCFVWVVRGSEELRGLTSSNVSFATTFCFELVARDIIFLYDCFAGLFDVPVFCFFCPTFSGAPGVTAELLVPLRGVVSSTTALLVDLVGVFMLVNGG